MHTNGLKLLGYIARTVRTILINGVFVVVVISGSLYTNHMRNIHLRSIKKTEHHFGIVAEKKNTLIQVARTLKYTVRLNYWVAIGRTIIAVFHTFEIFEEGNKTLPVYFVVTALHYLLSPVSYYLTQKELRVECKKRISKSRRRSVAPA